MALENKLGIKDSATLAREEKRISRNALKTSVGVFLLTVLFHFLFSVLFAILLTYWLMPIFIAIFPGMKVWAQGLDAEGDLAVFKSLCAVAAPLALFPAMTLGLRFSKKRKKEFIEHSKGTIPYKDAMVFHLKRYGLLDAIFFGTLLLVLAIVFAISKGALVVLVFPAAFFMFDTFGVVLGLVLTLLLMCLSMLFGIFFSQKKWRANYLIHQ